MYTDHQTTSPINLMRNTSPVVRGIRVALLFSVQNFVDHCWSFRPFSFGYCIVCPLNYGFSSEYPIGIIKLVKLYWSSQSGDYFKTYLTTNYQSNNSRTMEVKIVPQTIVPYIFAKCNFTSCRRTDNCMPQFRKLAKKVLNQNTIMYLQIETQISNQFLE